MYTHSALNMYSYHNCALCYQESSYRYWPEEVGEVMVCGRLRVRLELVNGLGEIEEKKLKATTMDDKIFSTRKLVVTMIHHISWSQQGLPHPSSIISLYDQLTEAQMRSSSQPTVVMCRLDTCCSACLYNVFIVRNIFSKLKCSKL